MQRFLPVAALVCTTTAFGHQAPGPSETPRPPAHDAAQADFATRLIAADGESERQAVLARYPPGVDPDLLRALIAEAFALIEATDYRKAAAVYELTIDLARRIDDRVNLASALTGLGSVHGRQGDYPAATRALGAGLAVAESIDDVERIDAALHNLGIVSRLQGEYEDALAYYDRVITLAQATGREHVLGPTYNNIGVVHMLRGSYRAALAALQRSVALKQAAGDEVSVRSTLTNIGNVYVEQGHPELALDYYRRSLDIAERFDQRAGRAFTLNDIGHAYAALGRHTLALDYYQRALLLHESAGRRAETATTLHNIGATHAARGDAARALDYLSRGLSIREAINDRPGMAASLVAIARLALARDRATEALQLADRAGRLAAETGNRESFWQARALAGRSHEAHAALESAQDAYLDAIDTIELLRADVAGADRDRQRYFEGKLEPYHRLAGLLVGRGRPAEALSVAERARARVLYEVLSAGPVERTLVDADARARERELERRLSELHSSLWAEASKPAPDRALVDQLESDLRAARLAHGELRATLYTTYPSLRLQRGDTAPGSVEAAATLLEDARTALLEFLVTEDTTYLFVLRREDEGRVPTVRTFRLELPRDRLRASVQRFRRQLESRDLAFDRSARELYDVLLAASAPAWDGATRLVIVPDEALWELPFQALRLPDGSYLIERVATSYAPSIGVLRELRERPRTTSRVDRPGLLALGDPALPSLLAGARASGFPALPDAARQVRTLSQVYGQESSRTFLGDAASEQALRELASDATVLHFATHGLADNASPMYSFLQLAGDPTGEAATDGRLEAWEVADLRLPVEAVVVAACETALGRVGPGEGMIGLSWAFFLAGSPRTIASQWKVDAESTTDLMVGFHRRFREGLVGDVARPGAAASLRDAALSVLRNSRYRHPFYWAGFIVVGDGS